MTDGQRMLFDMVHLGPYRGSREAPVCGFCGSEPLIESHTDKCPWPKFRDGIFEVWPEWCSSENSVDLECRMEQERYGPELPTVPATSEAQEDAEQ